MVLAPNRDHATVAQATLRTFAPHPEKKFSPGSACDSLVYVCMDALLRLDVIFLTTQHKQDKVDAHRLWEEPETWSDGVKRHDVSLEGEHKCVYAIALELELTLTRKTKFLILCIARFVHGFMPGSSG